MEYTRARMRRIHSGQLRPYERSTIESFGIGEYVPLRCKTCHGEESIDHVLLAHENGDEEVTDNNRSNLAGVRPFYAIPDEDTEVREEDLHPQHTVFLSVGGRAVISGGSRCRRRIATLSRFTSARESRSALAYG